MSRSLWRNRDHSMNKDANAEGSINVAAENHELEAKRFRFNSQRDTHRSNTDDAAKMRRCHTVSLDDAFKGALSKFQRNFLDPDFGVSCEVCERLWFDNNIRKIGNVKDSDGKEAPCRVLAANFPQWAFNVKKVMVCGTCKDALLKSVMPKYPTTFGYV